MSLFSCNLLVVFSPLFLLLASQWFILVVCAPQRRGEKKGRACAHFPFPPNTFYSSNHLKKWQKKEIPIQRLNCVYRRVIYSSREVFYAACFVGTPLPESIEVCS